MRLFPFLRLAGPLLLFFLTVKSDDDIATRIVKKLVINVPDSCERADMVVGNVCVKGMVCTHASVGALRSSPSVPDDGVSVTLSDIQLTCKGQYSYTLGNSQGDVDAAATVPTLALTVAVTRDTNDTSFPGTMTVPRCELNAVDLKLTFSGSISAWILSAISPVIESTVKSAIYKQTCPHMSASVASDGSAYVQQALNPALRSLLAAAAAVTPDFVAVMPARRSLYVNWTASFVVGLNQLAFSNFTRDWIQCFSGLPTFFPLGRLVGHWLNDTASVEVTFDGAALALPPLRVLGNVSATVQSVRVAGLEGLVLLDALRPSATDSLTLSSTLTAPALDVEVALLLTDTVSGEVVSDRGVLRVRATAPVVVVDVAVGAVVRRLNAIHLENLADLQAWVDALDFVNATSVALRLPPTGGLAVQVAITGGGDPDGSLDAAVFEALDRLAQVATGAYADLLARAVAAATQVYVRRIANDKVRAALGALKDGAAKGAGGGRRMAARLASPDPSALIAWADFKPLKLVHRLLYQLALPDMNRLTACLPNLPGGADTVAGWRLAGADSLFAFGVLDPVAASAQALDTALGVGACAANGGDNNSDCTPLYLNYTHPGGGFSAAATLRNFRVSFELAVLLGVKAFRGLRLADLAQPACLLPWFQDLALDALQLDASRIEVVTGGAVSADVTAAAKGLFRAASGPAGLRQLNHLLGQWKAAAERTCTATTVRPAPGPPPNDADVDADAAVDQGALATGAATVAAAAVFFSLVLLLARRKVVRCPRPYPLWTLDAQALETIDSGGGNGDDGGGGGDGDVYVAVDRVSGVPLRVPLQLPPRKAGAKPTQPRWTLAPSAVASPSSAGLPAPFLPLAGLRAALALAVDAMVPTAVVGAAALFAYSNGCAEAVVVVARASYGAYATLPQTVFGFGLVATVGALAEARAVALAALVAVFSGLWPYVKLSYLLVHWLRIATLPSALVGNPPRLLRAMEAFGKWSLVDFFIMAVAMAVFAVHQVLLVVQGSPVAAAVSVQPRAGFFAFLAGTLLSHLLSHALCAVDAAARRAAVLSPLSSSPPSSSPADCQQRPSRAWSLTLPAAARFVTRSRRIVRRCVQQQYASLPSSAAASPSSPGAAVAVLRPSRLGVALAVSAVAGCGALLVCGTAARTLHVEFSGLLQRALDTPLPPQDLSFYDVGRLLQAGSGLAPLSAGALFLQACFYACGLGAPLLLLKALGTLWLVPLPPRLSRRLLSAVRTLNAWSAVDVYCVSAAAVTLQVHQFVAFVVDKTCTGTAWEVLVAATSASAVSSSEGRCFEATGSLHVSFAALVAAAALLHALVFVTLRVAEAADTLRPPSRRLGNNSTDRTLLGGPSERCGGIEVEDVGSGLVRETSDDGRTKPDARATDSDGEELPEAGPRTSWASFAVDAAYWLGLLADEDDDSE